MAIFRTSKKWLDAQSEQNTILRTFPAYLTLVDLKNDDYFKLVIVEIPQNFRSDEKPKLKVYKGTTLISEQTLPGIPSSLKSFYVDDNDPKLPGKQRNVYSAMYLSKFVLKLSLHSDCGCYWTGGIFLQKYEAVLQVHVPKSKNRST